MNGIGKRRMEGKYSEKKSTSGNKWTIVGCSGRNSEFKKYSHEESFQSKKFLLFSLGKFKKIGGPSLASFLSYAW